VVHELPLKVCPFPASSIAAQNPADRHETELSPKV
jgi:hypothetical protein